MIDYNDPIELLRLVFVFFYNFVYRFTGGEAVQGGFAQTRGVRNYVGQFEEYVRWTKAGNENGRQRYTINTGKAGQTLKDVVDNYQTLVAD